MAQSSDLKNSELGIRSLNHQEVLDSLPIATYKCDLLGYITAYNDAAARLWGRRPQLGKELWCGSYKIFELDGTPVPLDLCPMAITLKTGKAMAGKEILIERPDGSRLIILAHPQPIFDDRGKMTGAINMLVDVTIQRSHGDLKQRTEELVKLTVALKRSEERYHRMVTEVEDYAIILLDTNGNIENWNKGAQKIKGYTADEIIGKHFSAFYSDEDRKKGIPNQLLEEARKKGKALHEGWRYRKDGSVFWSSVVITALHDDAGDVIGFTKVTRDLTEKKMWEEKLLATSIALDQKNKELERTNEELSSFAYISSHDLQEPLRKIQTFSDRVMEMEYDTLSEKGKDYFKRMQGAASRMQKLIRDILSYSRTATSEKTLEFTDLNELLAHSKQELEVIIMEKQAVIENGPLPQLKVIPFQVQQLFTNLLSNAVKFSKPDVTPRIVVTSEMVEGEKVHQPYAPFVKTYCLITISDNGIGFEPEYSRKIFEVFQRLHGRHEYGGTGIGLSICKKIVENHNGVITADSKPGMGATFRIYLPVVD